MHFKQFLQSTPSPFGIWRPSRAPLAEKQAKAKSVFVFPDEGNSLALAAAKIIADKIRSNNSLGKNTVLGLATGNTPLDVYRELVRMHKEEGLDFSRTITFNLDEYYGLAKSDVNSYHRFMWENLFEHINIKPENVHIPDGTVPRHLLPEYCAKYEQAISEAGGIDIQLLGIGKNGHIGFNEPNSPSSSSTRLIPLDESTRRSALPDFGERKYVPAEAITMGVATILGARQVILMATGEHKAKIIREAVEGKVSGEVVASYLQSHPNAKIFLDAAAASELATSKYPWAFASMDWGNNSLALKAVCSVCEATGKPIHALTTRDFARNFLGDLLRARELSELQEFALASLQGKIMGSDLLPKNKRILVFSPHPDDDIISMGGTLRKLVENNNQVMAAYMTPGYTAVFDHAARNFITSQKRFAHAFCAADPNGLHQKILDFLDRKSASQHGLPDIPEVLAVKRVIREVEAISTCEFVGVPSYLFLNLPFYQTGMARKMPITSLDITLTRQPISAFQPDIVFAAGDLTDPNGTHRLCLGAIRGALEGMERKPELWLYSGAWSEFPPSEADILVPLSPRDVSLKCEGIFRHESQKDKAPQPGHMEGEFWQMAEKRNAATAQLLSLYGIEGFGAMEAFKISK